MSIFLALLMLISNISFNVNTHYCGGQAVESSFSLGIDDLDCGMHKLDQECDLFTPIGDLINPKPCCENEHQVVQFEENIKLPVANKQIDQNDGFVNFLCAVYKAELISEPVNQVFSYRPPSLPEQNQQVLFQTFLI